MQYTRIIWTEARDVGVQVALRIIEDHIAPPYDQWSCQVPGGKTIYLIVPNVDSVLI